MTGILRFNRLINKVLTGPWKFVNLKKKCHGPGKFLKINIHRYRSLKMLEFILCRKFSGKKIHVIPSGPLMCYFANSSWPMHTCLIYVGYEHLCVMLSVSCVRYFVLYIAMTFTCAQNYYDCTSTFHRHTVKHCKNRLKPLKHYA